MGGTQKQAPEFENPGAGKPHRPWSDDPVARSTEWTGVSAWQPTRGGGAVSIRGASDSRVEFRPRNPRGPYVFVTFLAVVAAVIVYSQEGSIPQAVIPLLAGLGFSFILWLAIDVFGGGIIFDRSLGAFWYGREQPGQMPADGSSTRRRRIADIHALQLIGAYRYNGGDVDSQAYTTYELNLVMKDSTRFNVSSLDDFASLERDARVLSGFLGRPLWDAPP